MCPQTQHHSNFPSKTTSSCSARPRTRVLFSAAYTIPRFINLACNIRSCIIRANWSFEMRRKLQFGILLLAAICAPASGQSPSVSKQPDLPQITSGQHVTINGDHFPVKDIKVRLSTGRDEDKPLYRDASVQADGKALSFLADVPRGIYLVYVLIANAEPGLPVPGDLRVVADSDAPVKLTAIHPVTQYPNSKHIGYDLLLVGENFARNAQDNTIEIVGRGPEAPIYSEDCDTDSRFIGQPAESAAKYQPCLEVPKGLETKELRLVGFRPDKYAGPVRIQVRVAANNVSQPMTATMSRISAPTALLITLAVFLLLAWIVVRLVSKDVKAYQIGTKSYGAVVGFFLDKETNSYSLSKFQLLAWTAVSVFGYIYLFVCRSLVQWDLSFPPIPDNLPQLLAISAGTTVAATGITKSIGSKGAGPVQPSLADFVSAGGLVVGERFQFFVWTLVGCIGFVSLLFMTDPATLKELPKIPDGFLYLMGISSAGYLGGKVVRRPGPVVKLLSVSQVAESADQISPSLRPSANIKLRPPVLVFTVKGENLAKEATLKIDDHTLDRADDFWINCTPDPQTGLCTEVTVSLNDAREKGYMEGAHTLTFVNQDGQAATVDFPVDPMKIDMIENVPATDKTPASLRVTGKNFAKKGTSFEWRTPADATEPTAHGDIGETQVNGTTEIMIPIVNGMKGAGKLTLISPTKLRVSKEHTIP
jgi:hypothetical protein